MNTEPLFITFDGIDGCGKSTQLRLLADDLRRQGRDVAVCRDPGGPEISEKIREIILNPSHQVMGHRCELLLYEASRAQLVDEVIRPALVAGLIVLCDRFYDATFAYQGAGRTLEPATIRSFNTFAADGLVPTLTFILDISLELSADRLRQSGKSPDRLEQESRVFYQRVRENYLDLARFEPGRILVVDGSQKPEEIHKYILDRIREIK
jgi:dTMP kinase